MSQIKTSVSMYSLQDAYARGRLDLFSVLQFVADTGAQGVELISDQMIKGTPNPSEEMVAAWRKSLDASGLVPVCNDIFINSTIYKNRTLRPAEQIEMLKKEIEVSQRLGFDMVRLVSDTHPDVTLGALPYAEKLGVTMALEVHAGMSFKQKLTSDWIAMMKKTQSEHLGLVIDLGIFVQRLPRVFVNYFKTIGATAAVTDAIEKMYTDNGDTLRVVSTDGAHGGTFPEEITSLYKHPLDPDFAFFSTGYENTPLDVLDEHIDYIKHFHGKFYEMLPDGTEYSIDTPAIITRLNKLGYDGYISSEYEGNRFVPINEPVHDQEQVRAHQAMLATHINDGK